MSGKQELIWMWWYKDKSISHQNPTLLIPTTGIYHTKLYRLTDLITLHLNTTEYCSE